MDMGIKIDIAKAKDITKDRLRVERKPLLEALDVEFIKAQEIGADTSAIVTEKQRLTRCHSASRYYVYCRRT
jgi:hypothetical protein